MTVLNDLKQCAQVSKMAFSPGDVVQLKSGGPTMTVTNMEDSIIECIWFRPDATLEEHGFPAVVLVQYSMTIDDSARVAALQRRASDNI